MQRHIRLISILALLALVASAPGAAAPKPNIVYILADDLGWADVGFHGDEIKTPHIDRLAAAGTRLEAFYVQHVCSPTRAALLTGRYPIRYGLQTGVVQTWSKFGLPLEERTLPQALRDAGYRTAMVGKWHLGIYTPAYLPLQRGFDHHYGFYTGAINYNTHERQGAFDWHRNQEVCRDEGYATHLLAKEAVRLIEQHDTAKPLFLYIPFNAPHTPLQVPPEYLEAYPNLQGKRRLYADMVSALDEAVGQIVAAADRKGLRDNTLFIFSGDNGGDFPGEVASNGPLRGRKGTLYEGGTRVAAFATWQGRIPEGAVLHEPLHVVDWYPTLLRLAGASLDQPLPLDGRDLWPTLTRGKPSPHEVILINSARHNGAVRMGEWKLVINGHVMDTDPKNDAPEKIELFNLAQDPNEETNLAAKHPDKVRQLRAQLDRFAREAAPPKDVPKPRGLKTPKVWGDFSATASH